jgi:transposase
MRLTIEQRDRLRAALPSYEQKPTGRRRSDLLKVFEAILWVLESGARWEDIDKYKYGVSYQTCHRYFQEWTDSGVFERALAELIRDGEDAGLLGLHETYIDGSFVRAKGGATRLPTATRAKGAGSWPT